MDSTCIPPEFNGPVPVIPVIVTEVLLVVVALVEVPLVQARPEASVTSTNTPASGEPPPSTTPALGNVTSVATTT